MNHSSLWFFLELLQLRAQEMGKMRKGNLLDDLLRQRDKNGRTVLFHCLDCNSISGNIFDDGTRLMNFI